MYNHHRPTWIEIHIDHLLYNYQYYQHKMPNKTIIPVIKANAYGHGAVQVFNMLYEQGVRLFAVSLLEEALELKMYHRDADILMMGAILEHQLDVAHQEDIIITLYDKSIYQAIKVYDHPLRIHVKIDTGMHRYGLMDDDESLTIISDLIKHTNHQIEGIYTHFATATDDMDYYHKQSQRFESFINKLEVKPNIIHCSNSSSMDKEETQFTYTTHARLGISLYGLSLEKNYPEIKEVLKLKTKIVMIKELKAGECLGYGLTYCAKEDERIGLLPIGYADGWIRKNKHGHIIIDNKAYSIVGNICMDTTFIKIDKSVSLYDTVTLIGDGMKADKVADRLKTINYEVVTNLSDRIPRIYMKDGEKI